MKLPPPFALWRDQIRIEMPGTHVMFTTRRGGISEGPYAELNLGRLTDDRPESVEENRRRVEEMTGAPLAAIRQVHGTRVIAVPGSGGRYRPVTEADGLVTREKGVAPAVLVADCLPIVVAGDGGFAVLHAGWRGLAGGIIREGISALRELGCDGELEAAIGPGAGPCCYEVGEEVHREFAAYGSEVRRGGNLDLGAIARRQLQESSVTTIHDVGLCTICSEDGWLFSHRRDGGVTGRQGGIAWMS